MFLIVGLGNPGKSYINNRHNIGYKIIDHIRAVCNFPDFSKNFQSEFSKSDLDTNIVILIKPTTYMNNSGIAVNEIKNFYNIDIKNIYVIHDEIDLDPGRVKVKIGGGHNGHNGLKSIDNLIGKNYNRIRVGVSRPSKIYEEKVDENISNWVLSNFSTTDNQEWLNDTIVYVSKMIVSIIKNQNDS
tara:strand:+ start:418 stop:975 length:558 start_codon:yes stop_codon:yes gene_type:complete